jgi:hypothetical protein
VGISAGYGNLTRAYAEEGQAERSGQAARSGKGVFGVLPWLLLFNSPMRQRSKRSNHAERCGKRIHFNYEHAEKTRAPHTNGPRDVPRYGALSLLQKPIHYSRIHLNSFPAMCMWALAKLLLGTAF